MQSISKGKSQRAQNSPKMKKKTFSQTKYDQIKHRWGECYRKTVQDGNLGGKLSYRF
jgi:hypothetical protein